MSLQINQLGYILLKFWFWTQTESDRNETFWAGLSRRNRLKQFWSRFWTGSSWLNRLKPAETGWDVFEAGFELVLADEIGLNWLNRFEPMKPIETIWNRLKPFETDWNRLKLTENRWTGLSWLNRLKPFETVWNRFEPKKPIETKTAIIGRRNVKLYHFP